MMFPERRQLARRLRTFLRGAALASWALAADVAPARDASPQLHVSRNPARVNPAAAKAFDAFNSGDLIAAEAGYRQALADEPANAEALHALAVVALRRNDPGHAELLYRRAVEVDPRDAVAQAGLIAFRIDGDPTAAAARLRTLLAARPDEPVFHFQLGNAYAAAGRWSDAQQAFAGACGLAPDQPDYLYNLAVSFDRLRRTTLAHDYYERALAAAKRRPAAFDPVVVSARTHQLRY